MADFRKVVNDLRPVPADDAPERAKGFHQRRPETMTDRYSASTDRLTGGLRTYRGRLVRGTEAPGDA